MNNYSGGNWSFKGGSMNGKSFNGFQGQAGFPAYQRQNSAAQSGDTACEPGYNGVMQNGAVQGNVMMQRPDMNFGHYHHSDIGIAAGATIVLVWLFLIFGIVAFAKWIFWGGTVAMKRENTSAS